MKDKDLLEESPKNIFHDLMISKIIKKKTILFMQGGIYDSISPLFPPLVEQLKMVNTTH